MPALLDCRSTAISAPPRRARVRAYASGGYFLEGKGPAMLAAECRGYVEAGFRAVKIKVGRHADPGREEERVAAVRDAIGPDVLLMLDANNAWPDLAAALPFIRRYERHDCYFIEEPFSPDDIESHARLVQSTTMLVATGEIEAGRWRFRDLLDRRAAHILQTDACVAGGITEFRRIAAIAAGYGVPLMPHWFHDLHAHLVAATPECALRRVLPRQCGAELPQAGVGAACRRRRRAAAVRPPRPGFRVPGQCRRTLPTAGTGRGAAPANDVNYRGKAFDNSHKQAEAIANGVNLGDDKAR